MAPFSILIKSLSSVDVDSVGNAIGRARTIPLAAYSNIR